MGCVKTQEEETMGFSITVSYLMKTLLEGKTLALYCRGGGVVNALCLAFVRVLT